MSYRRANRQDTNHKAFRDDLRDVVAEVKDTSHIGHGVPDLRVHFGGFWFWVDVKSDDGEITPLQAEYCRMCPEQIFIAAKTADWFLKAASIVIAARAKAGGPIYWCQSDAFARIKDPRGIQYAILGPINGVKET